MHRTILLLYYLIINLYFIEIVKIIYQLLFRYFSEAKHKNKATEYASNLGSIYNPLFRGLYNNKIGISMYVQINQLSKKKMIIKGKMHMVVLASEIKQTLKEDVISFLNFPGHLHALHIFPYIYISYRVYKSSNTRFFV